jgi:hypothetical protein
MPPPNDAFSTAVARLDRAGGRGLLDLAAALGAPVHAALRAPAGDSQSVYAELVVPSAQRVYLRVANLGGSRGRLSAQHHRGCSAPCR